MVWPTCFTESQTRQSFSSPVSSGKRALPADHVLNQKKIADQTKTVLQCVHTHRLRLLVLDIDYTIFDCKSPSETITVLKRPYLDTFLALVWGRLPVWAQPYCVAVYCALHWSPVQRRGGVGAYVGGRSAPRNCVKDLGKSDFQLCRGGGGSFYQLITTGGGGVGGRGVLPRPPGPLQLIILVYAVILSDSPTLYYP